MGTGGVASAAVSHRPPTITTANHHHHHDHQQGEYDEEASMKAWEKMMDRYADRWNVMSVDLRCVFLVSFGWVLSVGHT